MSDIKKKNIDFWTINVPGIDNQVCQDMVGTLDFYKKVDEVRYQQEPYLNGLFNEVLEPGLVSLEVGCGLGSDLRTFAQYGLKVTGLDYSPENAYLSKLGLQICNLEGRVISGDAECLPFPDNCFDLVYSFGCLHHTPNTQKGIDEISRVLRPGGKILVMLYHTGYQFWFILFCYIFWFGWLKKSLQNYISCNYDQTPLSQMFSKKQLRKMFYSFCKVDIRIENFGGIQFHSILKYVWKIFKRTPWLKRKLGSFAIIFARKPGNFSQIKDSPQLCCPLCYSALDYQIDSIRCVNLRCGAQFVNYKKEISMLHPNAVQLYQDWLENKRKSNRNI